MKKFALIVALALSVLTSGCALLIPKYYVENKSIAHGDLDVVVTEIYPRDGVSTRNGSLVYVASKGQTFFSVYIKITNNTKHNYKTDLTKAYLIKGKTAIKAWLCNQGAHFLPVVAMEPVKVLEPGESITRDLVYSIPKGQVPDAFIWKGVGELRIPQTPPKG